MTDPDTESIWLFFGRRFYLWAVGYTAWLFFVGDDDTFVGDDDSTTLEEGRLGPTGL
jgi:hypothetical protein